MTPGERRLQIGNWRMIEEAIEHGYRLEIKGNSSSMTAELFNGFTDELHCVGMASRIEWALDDLNENLAEDGD